MVGSSLLESFGQNFVSSLMGTKPFHQPFPTFFRKVLPCVFPGINPALAFGSFRSIILLTGGFKCSNSARLTPVNLKVLRPHPCRVICPRPQSHSAAPQVGACACLRYHLCILQNIRRYLPQHDCALWKAPASSSMPRSTQAPSLDKKFSIQKHTKLR
jgi:hypothetical protein